jgi:hypothetical protein
MFTGISWTDYMVAVAIALTLYYGFVAFWYYSEEFKDLLSDKGKLNFRTPLAESYPSEELNSPPSESGSFNQTNDDDFTEVEELIVQIKDAVAIASKKKYVIQEFKHSLRLIFREYPNIKKSPIRSSINELLVSECEKQNTVALSEEEVDRLWLETV